MSTKTSQVNVRVSEDLDAWLEERAGGRRKKPEFVRRLLEREKALEEEASIRAMFDEAWDRLSDGERAEERAERELWLGGYAGRAEES